MGWSSSQRAPGTLPLWLNLDMSPLSSTEPPAEARKHGHAHRWYAGTLPLRAGQFTVTLRRPRPAIPGGRSPSPCNHSASSRSTRSVAVLLLMALPLRLPVARVPQPISEEWPLPQLPSCGFFHSAPALIARSRQSSGQRHLLSDPRCRGTAARAQR